MLRIHPLDVAALCSVIEGVESVQPCRLQARGETKRGPGVGEGGKIAMLAIKKS